MPMNRVQFQPGLSMPEFTKLYSTEAQCESVLVQFRWPTGFSCPACGHREHCRLPSRPRMTFQCNACHRQTSLIAGTLFQGSNLVSYPMSWLATLTKRQKQLVPNLKDQPCRVDKAFCLTSDANLDTER